MAAPRVATLRKDGLKAVQQKKEPKQSIGQKRQVFKLFAQACELPVEERTIFLDQACGDDAALRRQLESLLASDHHAAAGPGLLERPAFDIHAEDAMIGRSIGHYRLVKLLDRGGMGAVYLAERQDFEQQVALKLIRRGLDLDEVLVRRFHNERQILASLEHPHIARLLDGGTTHDQLPYFVMEYVEGEPIDSYAKDRGLSIEERLELFRKVCSAVQFAHQNLVIHRDLKPGNILITDDGEPKLLDFGIARLLDEGGGPQGVITTSGQGPMTPRYASPEQIKNAPISTASDVYSLGVLLYELLTGLDPYEVDTDRSDELARAICELPPSKPSTAVRQRAPRHRAAATSLSREKLGRRLAGDLDCIVLKTLRKEPQGRYNSAEQLSADIHRYLRGLPVEARVGSFTYRARRFVERHQLALAVALAFVLLLAGSGTVSTVLWRQAVAQREQAEQESRRAQEAYRFLSDLLGTAAPDQAKGETLTALKILDRGKEKLAGEDLEPELRIEIAGTLGRLYRDLGFYDRSRELMEMALAVARDRYPHDHPEVAKCQGNLAVLLYDFENHSAAERHSREALAMRLRLGQPPAELLRIKSNLAAVLMRQGRLEEAEELYLSVLATRIELYEPEYGRDDTDIATSQRNLGTFYYARGDFDKAEFHLRKALGIRRRAWGSKHTSVASVLDPLGNVLAAAGRSAEAEAMLSEALAIRQELLDDDHLTVARSKLHLAALLAESAPDTASILLTQALETFYSADPGDSETADAESLLGVLLTNLGEYEDAEPCLLESSRRLEEVRGPHNIRTRRAQDRLLALYTAWGRPP